MAKQDGYPVLFDSKGCALNIFSGDDTWHTLKKCHDTWQTHTKTCLLNAKPGKAIVLSQLPSRLEATQMATKTNSC